MNEPSICVCRLENSHVGAQWDASSIFFLILWLCVSAWFYFGLHSIRLVWFGLFSYFPCSCVQVIALTNGVDCVCVCLRVDWTASVFLIRCRLFLEFLILCVCPIRCLLVTLFFFIICFCIFHFFPFPCSLCICFLLLLYFTINMCGSVCDLFSSLFFHTWYEFWANKQMNELNSNTWFPQHWKWCDECEKWENCLYADNFLVLLKSSSN